MVTRDRRVAIFQMRLPAEPESPRHGLAFVGVRQDVQRGQARRGVDDGVGADGDRVQVGGRRHHQLAVQTDALVRPYGGPDVWSMSSRRPGMDADEVSAEDIELEYVSTARVRERGPVSRLWPVPFESVPPECRLPAFRGQGNWCGWYWSATCGGHVGYESWLERDRLMLFDFDPLVR
ncbi:hypothetical protein ACFVXC_29190 [Streptomyces sp. NPDC058257]|uniref:hypothetical protein n=1 Tax=Streptomyces sp. NPDC058257 TaxID=3346409 RepID=UPI0036EFD083